MTTRERGEARECTSTSSVSNGSEPSKLVLAAYDRRVSHREELKDGNGVRIETISTSSAESLEETRSKKRGVETNQLSSDSVGPGVEVVKPAKER